MTNTAGMGPSGHCICLHCGFKKRHEPGTPCREETCPTCKKPLVREGSIHHVQFKNKIKGGE
jgi:hypothetical protein